MTCTESHCEGQSDLGPPVASHLPPRTLQHVSTVSPPSHLLGGPHGTPALNSPLQISPLVEGGQGSPYLSHETWSPITLACESLLVAPVGSF